MRKNNVQRWSGERGLVVVRLQNADGSRPGAFSAGATGRQLRQMPSLILAIAPCLLRSAARVEDLGWHLPPSQAFSRTFPWRALTRHQAARHRISVTTLASPSSDRTFQTPTVVVSSLFHPLHIRPGPISPRHGSDQRQTLPLFCALQNRVHQPSHLDVVQNGFFTRRQLE